MNRLLLAVAIVASCVVTASAQPAAGARGGGIGAWVTRSSLVRQESVQADLGITADQKAKLDAELAAAGPGGGGNPREMSEDERQKWREERRARAVENDKKLTGILDAKQLSRLDQIRVQALGGGVVMDEELAAQLGITDDQRAAFRTEMQKLREESPAGGGPGGMRERMTATVMSLLTPEQKAKLDALRGPAFDVSTLQMRGRGGQRGGD